MMDGGVRPIAKRDAGRWVCLLAAGSLLALAGCSESIKQYTRFRGWSTSPSKPVVFSGNPSRDASAFGASETVLTEHDWQALERIAPRPIWERLAALREQFSKDAKAATRPARPRKAAAPEVRAAADVPTVRLPDGKVQMFYRLRHYGGVGVAAALDGGTARRQITRTPANLSTLVALVQAQLAGKGTVTALPEENTLVITCDPQVKQSVLMLLARYSTRSRRMCAASRCASSRWVSFSRSIILPSGWMP